MRAEAGRISSARLTPGITRYRRKILPLINHGLRECVNISDHCPALATTASREKLFLCVCSPRLPRQSPSQEENRDVGAKRTSE